MSDFSDLSTVKHILEKKAAWRATKAKRFPEDPRNEFASEELYQIASSDEPISGHISARLAPYWSRVGFDQAVDDVASIVGFSRHGYWTLNSFLESVAQALEASGRRTVPIPALNAGVSCGILKLAFEQSIEAYEAWENSEPEPAVATVDCSVLISDVFGRMWNCTDIMQASICRAVANVLINDDRPFPKQGATFAQAARRLLPLVKEARNAAR